MIRGGPKAVDEVLDLRELRVRFDAMFVEETTVLLVLLLEQVAVVVLLLLCANRFVVFTDFVFRFIESELC